MDLVQVLENRWRLHQHRAAEIEGWQPHLGIHRTVAVGLLLALEKVDRHRLVGNALEVEGDAHPISRRRPEIGIKLHAGPSPMRGARVRAWRSSLFIKADKLSCSSRDRTEISPSSNARASGARAS